MREHDWRSLPLGTPATWPQTLRTVVRLMLNTGHPMYIWWGPDSLASTTMPTANRSVRSAIPDRWANRPARSGPGFWDIIGPQIDHVMSGRGATWHENALVPITRHGSKEDVYWTYSYGPIDDDTGPNGVGGVLGGLHRDDRAVLAHARNRSSARQRRLFEQAPGFIIIMRGAEITSLNLSTMLIVPSSDSHDWVGRSIRRAFPSIEGQGFFELLDRVFERGDFEATRHAGALPAPRRSNAPETRYLTFIYAPLYDDDGR